MKKTFKRTLGILLVLALMIAMVPMTAFAAAPTTLTITGVVPKLSETTTSFREFTLAEQDVHVGNARWIYSLPGEDNYDDPHSANHSEDIGDTFKPGRRYKLWLTVFIDNGISGYFNNSLRVTYNGTAVPSGAITFANGGKACNIALSFDPLTATVKKPTYKGDIVEDGMIHQISEFYDFSSMPSGTQVFRQVDDETSVTLDAHGDLSPLEVRLPVETSFTLKLPAGYTFEEDGSTSMECKVRVTSAAPTQSYTVSFDANGGIGTMADVTVTDSTYVLPYCNFKSSGSKYFGGWSLSKTGNPIMQSKITLSGDTTLYALWKSPDRVLDKTEIEYDNRKDVKNTVYYVDDTQIDDPGNAKYLDENYRPCEKADAAWQIKEINYGEYQLTNKGEEVKFGQTDTLVSVQYETLFATPIITAETPQTYQVLKIIFHYERIENFYTNDTYERTANVILTEVEEEAPEYSIIKGANGKWTKGSSSGLSFTSDAPFDKFDGVTVDGSAISEQNYTAEEGSTKITLSAEYLGTLSEGKHSIEILATDGSASTDFTVKASGHISPKTGDSSNLLLWAMLMIFSIAGLAGAVLFIRNRNIKNN